MARSTALYAPASEPQRRSSPLDGQRRVRQRSTSAADTDGSQLPSARFTAVSISLTVICKSPSRLPASQLPIGTCSSAMPTSITISLTVTVPLPSQSPAHIAEGAGVTVEVGPGAVLVALGAMTGVSVGTDVAVGVVSP